MRKSFKALSDFKAQVQRDAIAVSLEKDECIKPDKCTEIYFSFFPCNLVH